MDYKTRRKAMGLTLDDIADIAGCSRQNVFKFESGKYKNSRCESVYDHLEQLRFEKYYSDTDSICILKNEDILEE